MKRIDYPAYNKALKQYIDGNFKYFNRYRKNKELSHAERKLLEVRHLFISQNWAEARKLANEVSTNCSFLLGDKYFLMAFSHTMEGDHQDSIAALEQAFKYYEDCDDRRGRFLCCYNMATDFGRLGDRVKTNESLEQAYSLAKFPGEKLGILRSQAAEESLDSNFESAMAKLEEAFALDLGERDINEMDLNVLKSVAADIYFRAGHREECETLLEELKGCKSNYFRGRVSFRIYLLSCFKENKKLGQMPLGVKNSNEYQLKWDIIKSVQTGDVELANERWSQLCEMFPEVYAPNFKCKRASDEKALFYAYLQRYLKKDCFDPAVFKKLKGSNLQKLYQLLATSAVPLRKEYIIEQIWGCYEPEYDNRFYLLVKRLKKELGPRVQKFNSSYSLKQVS